LTMTARPWSWSWSRSRSWSWSWPWPWFYWISMLDRNARRQHDARCRGGSTRRGHPVLMMNSPAHRSNSRKSCGTQPAYSLEHLHRLHLTDTVPACESRYRSTVRVLAGVSPRSADNPVSIIGQWGLVLVLYVTWRVDTKTTRADDHPLV
jgi:hypothetical protein